MSLQELAAQAEKPSEARILYEAKLFSLDQYLVIAPSMLLMLIGAYDFLLIFALVSVALDFASSLSKLVWLVFSIVTIPFAVACYYYAGVLASDFNLTLPHTDELSQHTIAIALILAKLFTNTLASSGMAYGLAEFKIRQAGE